MKQRKPRIEGPDQRAERYGERSKTDDARDSYARQRIDEDLRARKRRRFGAQR